MNKEFLRMQQLAGLLTEINISTFPPRNFQDETRALGVLFHPNEDEPEEYEWDVQAIEDFCKYLGYEDYQEVTKEIIHYTSPGNNDEMAIFRRMTQNPDLKVSDLTIGMYRQDIENNFEK